MVRKQWSLVFAGSSLLAALFYFGPTVAKKSNTEMTAPPISNSFNIDQFISEAKKKLDPSRLAQLDKMENSVKRGDLPGQHARVYGELAAYWKDSLHSFEPYAYYLAESAKLDKSEKNLTFAGQLILDNLRGESDEARLNWKTDLAISLFEKAIELNPGNDELKIGLGSCYVFGKGRTGGPQETMKGIQQLLAVVRRDSNNMKAQLVLGVGGFVSGQYDKAIERLLKVVKVQPGNLEAIAFLADSYAAKGDKPEAVKWYQVSVRLADNPQYTKEVNERIKALR